MRLNDKLCKSLKPKEKSYKQADGFGLYLEVMPNGSKYWRWKYRFNGKEKRLALGVYPTITLAKARELREMYRKQLAEGHDPSQLLKEQKRVEKQQDADTFEKVAREWHAYNLDKWTPHYGETIMRRLEIDVFKCIGTLPVSKLTAKDILDCLKRIESRGAQEMAKRSLQVISQVMRYGVIHGHCTYNPANDLKGALKPKKVKHYNAITVDELPDLVRTLRSNNARLYKQTIIAVEILMLTFVRTGELINAKWDEFNLDEAMWVIPAERMKMKREHMVPLSDRVVFLLKELNHLNPFSPWVFASPTKPNQPISNNTILKALERMGYKGRMTGHGFRALAMSTIKEKLGYRHEVIDRQLAHAHKSAVDAAYDRAMFLDERKKMMQDWSNFIETIT